MVIKGLFLEDSAVSVISHLSKDMACDGQIVGHLLETECYKFQSFRQPSSYSMEPHRTTFRPSP